MITVKQLRKILTGLDPNLKIVFTDLGDHYINIRKVKKDTAYIKEYVNKIGRDTEAYNEVVLKSDIFSNDRKNPFIKAEKVLTIELSKRSKLDFNEVEAKNSTKTIYLYGD